LTHILSLAWGISTAPSCTAKSQSQGSASGAGKRLFVVGENFDPGAVLLRNGVEQVTKNDPQNPHSALIGKKAGKNLEPGDVLKVRNPNGTLSQEFIFAGS
jgi:hypothetical protein